MDYTRVLTAVLWSIAFLNFQPAKARPSLSNLPLEAKIGQLFMIGLPSAQLSKEDIQQLRRIRPGGIILFARNIKSLKQVSELNEQLQQLSTENRPLPLLIALDQEGGRVVRVKTKPSLPSPLAMGKTDDPVLVEEISYETGKLIRSLGFNMNLAPVLDIIPVSGSSFIGERSFGTHPDKVTKMGLAFALGQVRSRIIPTAKHFPGSGQSKLDPHVDAGIEWGATKNSDSAELKPFRIYADLFPTGIMLSHIAYPSLDKSRSPATFSKEITTGILRKAWGYDGLVVTDDLLMAAARAKFGIKNSVLKSFEAGADILMITWSRRDQVIAHSFLLEAVKSGRIKMSDLDTRVARILRAKEAVEATRQRRHPTSDASFHSSEKIRELDKRVLIKNLNTEFKKLAGSKLPKKFIAVNSLPSYAEDFKRLHRGDTLLAGASLQSIEQIADSHPDAGILFPVTSKKMAIFVNSLPRKLRSRTIVVELTSTSMLSDRNFVTVMRLYHSHEALGEGLAQLLNQGSEALKGGLTPPEEPVAPRDS